ncbi:recombinase family protein [Rhizobium sp. FKL33]|uniref:recombinase family protein n=1 Tax=Rhizobium sp. FKL33 TaxID=2562307 RepID=UPI0010BF8586|nr:recombinase family protein [Rhizobium sp. FKL33]
MSEKGRLRCAIYTRKSSEEGLDQSFNSLDAQREACAAFITSQASLGWRLIPEFYDDGGISGGTLERPAIQRLLQHIREGRIDIVVVYKIDRLTRSLMDFSKLVDVFDRHSVSFVSVTQQFNTTTSMGRLTLNVLLSFAQFEREVTAERIRDKIAASKQKGMFMGGRVPLGYRLDNRKLEVDEDDADYVRHLFRRVVELKSVSAVKHEIDAACKSYAKGNTEMETPRRWRAMTHGQLRYLLSNPTYIGKITHKGRIHDGEQQAIVSQDLFDAVQAEITEIRTAGRRGRGAPDIHLLNGIAFDETGDRLSPSSAAKGLRRYRYYLSHRLQKSSRGRKDGWRLPADEFERIALSQANAVVENANIISTWLEQAGAGNAIAAALDRLNGLKDDLASPDPFRRRDSFRLIFKAITISPSDIRFDVNRDALIKALIPDDQHGAAKPTDSTDNNHDDDETSIITVPMTMKRRGVEMRMVVSAGNGREPDQALIDLIARAHIYLNRLTNGSASSIAELADQLGVHRADISRILPLAFLSPQLTESILSGRQPADLTVRTLSRLVDIPASWTEQAALLGG